MIDRLMLDVATYGIGYISDEWFADPAMPDQIATHFAMRAAREAGQRLWAYSGLVQESYDDSRFSGSYSVRVVLHDAPPPSGPLRIHPDLTVLVVPTIT